MQEEYQAWLADEERRRQMQDETLAIATCMYRRYYVTLLGGGIFRKSYARKTSVFYTVLYRYIREW